MLQYEESFIELLKKINTIRKALLIKLGSLGKTSILNALTKQFYVTQNTDYVRTPFINFGTISIKDVNNEIVRIQFHDLAGHLDLPIHFLKDFSRQTLGATEIIFLVFATDNLQSLLDLQKWISLVNEGLSVLYLQPNIILIRNKTDVVSRVDHKLGIEFLSMNPLIRQYFEITCVIGTGLNALLKYLSIEMV